VELTAEGPGGLLEPTPAVQGAEQHAGHQPQRDTERHQQNRNHHASRPGDDPATADVPDGRCGEDRPHHLHQVIAVSGHRWVHP
jgi:hypothetical protein